MRQFFSITLPSLKYTLITSSTLMVVGALTYADPSSSSSPEAGPGATRILPLDMYLPASAATRWASRALSRRCSMVLGWISASACSVSAARTPPPARWKEPDMKRNWIGGAFGWLWLAVVLLPIYFVLITSLKSISTYSGSNPVLPSLPLAFENVTAVLEADFTVPAQQRAGRRGHRDPPGPDGVLWPATPSCAGPAGCSSRCGVCSCWNWRSPCRPSCRSMISSRCGCATPWPAPDLIPAIAFGLPLSILIISNSLRDVPKEALRGDGRRPAPQLKRRCGASPSRSCARRS